MYGKVENRKQKCNLMYLSFLYRFTILNAIMVTKPIDLLELVNTDARVILLYSTYEEAKQILSAANDYKITGVDYVWVVTQSVIGNMQTQQIQFPVGMLGEYFSLDKRIFSNKNIAFFSFFSIRKCVFDIYC